MTSVPMTIPDHINSHWIASLEDKQNTVLQKLNDQIAELTQMLSLEKASKSEMADNLAALQASLGKDGKLASLKDVPFSGL